MTNLPYDQQLADLIDAEVVKHHPTLSHRPEADEREIRHTFTEWFDGWDTAVEVAARIVAERAALQPPPVIDLRPRPDLTMDVLRRLKARHHQLINPSDVSVIASCILESLAEAQQ